MHVWPLYAALAFGACAASWRNVDLRPVGIAIVASLAASNAAFYGLSPTEQPAAYTVAEVMVLSMSFLAHVCGGSKWLVLLVSTCIVSIGLNIRMTMLLHPTVGQVYGWHLATNLCFGVECALVVILGLYDRARSRNADGGVGTALHGRAPTAAETKR